MPKNDGGSELRVCISPQRQSRTSLWPRPGMRKHSLASAAPLHMSAWLCHPLIACRRKKCDGGDPSYSVCQQIREATLILSTL